MAMTHHRAPAVGGHEGPGAGDGPEDGDVLPCGRPLRTVWEEAEAAAHDPHVADCPHCSAAVARLDLLEEAVRRTRDQEPRDPDAAGLTQRVMDLVRLELRPGRTLPLGGFEEDTWIVEAAAAGALRAAADRLPGVLAGSCTLTPPPEPRRRGPVTVAMEIVVAGARPLPDAAEEVRRSVYRAAETELGMEVAAVHVRVADLLDGPPTGGGA